MPAVIVDRVSKRFKKVILRSGYTTAKTTFTHLFRHRMAPTDYVDSLRNVSLSVARGETLGIIGRNGSGKSTLVRTIAGIYPPTSGDVRTEGRVSALIDLGAGFHPEFTGRENVYISGIVLGLPRRDITRRFDDIVRFAGLEEFIDSPVRTYSTGMYLRLGFSVAVHVDPDILLVDEVLTVGDETFVRKCLGKMDEFRRRGKTLVVASHDLSLVERWCDAAVLLEEGRVAARGCPASVVEAYRQSMVEREACTA